MKKIDVVVFNSHGVGQYAYCNKLPEWGETLSVKNWHIAEDGGKESNVAVALGRLGVNTSFICKVGNDAWGDVGEKWLHEAGVDTTYLYRTDEVATGTGLILIGPNGKNSIIDGDSSSSTLTEEEVINALDNLSNAKYLVTGFEVPIDHSILAAKYAHEKGLKVALNPSPLPEKRISDLSFVDYLFVNEIEGKFFTDHMKDENLDSKILLKEIINTVGCKNVIMTLGDKGSISLGIDGYIEIEAVSIDKDKIKNTAGAGDGYMAACISALIKGKTLESAMKFASYYSALSITIDGTIPAYRPLDEVEDFIDKYI